MALEDFMGQTSEIKVIDFLAENMDRSYNQTEISENTSLSRPTVNQKIRELIQSNILVVDTAVGKFKTFKLADNDIVKYLVIASLAHSFKQAENPLSEEEQKELIKKKLGGDEERGVSNDIEDAMIRMPIDGSIILSRDTAEKVSRMLDEKLKPKMKRMSG